ncbi:hypothetical protein [Komagataeibacter xylinus]|uniref:Uncharacterized protein n=1 Tax=Komagataeibacter xylinus TaxID=28448 RepID=A0A857FP74_KOMXY|nr:hypothetical protein [Komagataeibacter xylinus]QHC35982.1 hypothetical protein FMA36_11215 [Komagataeibacter xylinus]
MQSSSCYVLFGIVAGGIRTAARNLGIGIKRGAKAVVRSRTDIFDGVLGLMAIALGFHEIVSIEQNDDIISK